MTKPRPSFCLKPHYIAPGRQIQAGFDDYAGGWTVGRMDSSRIRRVCGRMRPMSLIRRGAAQRIRRASSTIRIRRRRPSAAFWAVRNLPIFFSSVRPRGTNRSPGRRRRIRTGGTTASRSNHSVVGGLVLTNASKSHSLRLRIRDSISKRPTRSFRESGVRRRRCRRRPAGIIRRFRGPGSTRMNPSGHRSRPADCGFCRPGRGSDDPRTGIARYPGFVRRNPARPAPAGSVPPEPVREEGPSSSDP